jgi:hypothetical protein
VWGIKGLMYDIIRDGDGAITGRLSRVVQPPLTQEQLTLLAGDLPPSLVSQCQERWLPALMKEVPEWRAHGTLPANGAAAAATTGDLPVSGRWRADSADCSLQYLPRRHQDLFLRNWLDLSGEQYDRLRGPVFAPVFDSVSSPYSPGRCMKCHSTEKANDDSRRVQWWPARPDPDDHPFTTFAHGPHFDLLGGHRCDTCHTLAVGSKYQESYWTPDHAARTDARGYVSNFLPMEKVTCVTCHTARQAGDSCLLCHNYHVGQFSPFHAPREPLRGFPSRPLKPRASRP